MSYSHGYTVTVHVREAGGGTDAYGNELVVWTDWTYLGCAFWHGKADVSHEHYEVTSSAATVLLPADAGVKLADEVTIEGTRWKVDGVASTLTSVFTGYSPGVLVGLERIA